MIRVAKSSYVPDSLQKENNTTYNHSDVQKQLIRDHNGKCYLCERNLTTDYHIEHLIPQNNPEECLRTDWFNLFLACSYCNRKKSHTFDKILNPLENDIEDLILSKHQPGGKFIEFSPYLNSSESINQTIELLSSIFNGRKAGMRIIREEKFYEYFLSKINNFLSILSEYALDKSISNKNLVIEELNIEKEFLMFKYHKIKEQTPLYNDFKDYMIWNKI